MVKENNANETMDHSFSTRSKGRIKSIGQHQNYRNQNRCQQVLHDSNNYQGNVFISPS